MDPVHIKAIATAALAAGSVILFGAAYGIFYALAQLRTDRRLKMVAFASYVALLAAALILAHALDLHGIWQLLIGTLLFGYLIAPPLMWRLSAAVHAVDQQVQASRHE